jgi:hypothetical protein
LETTLQVALETKLAKAVCHGLCACPPGLEKGHARRIEILINVVSIEDLSDKSRLLGVFLGLDPYIDVVTTGPVEQLAHSGSAGPDSG